MSMPLAEKYNKDKLNTQIEFPFWEIKDAYKQDKMRVKYQDNIRAIQRNFRADLIQTYLPGNRKAEKVFFIAWKTAHNRGYEEVEKCFKELAELVTSDDD